MGGEAKRKATATARFLVAHPWCCYCGGNQKAETIDHVPSRQMFLGRDRPSGLEVPACKPCNEATRIDEQVAAMIGRLLPDPTRPEHIDELRRVFRGVANNVPGIFEEMKPSFRQIKKMKQLADSPNLHALNVNGPLVNTSMTAFSVKLAFALHFNCAGKIIPPAGGVIVRWFSNAEAIEGKIPTDFLKFFSEPQTLRQGRKSVGEQFFFVHQLSSDEEGGVYFAAFRKSFAVAAIVRHEATKFDPKGNAPVYRPGVFRSAKFVPS